MLRNILAAACFALIASEASAANKVWISEFSVLPTVQNTKATNWAAMPPVAEQGPIDFTAGATASAAFNSQTRYIRVVCDSRCSVRVSTAGTAATTANQPLPADRPEHFGVQPGDKISVIASP